MDVIIIMVDAILLEWRGSLAIINIATSDHKT